MGQGMTDVQTRYQSNFRLATDIESVNCLLLTRWLVRSWQIGHPFNRQ